MNYIDWNILVITLFQNGVEINKSFTMRSDIEKMDTLTVKTLLVDVLSMMTSETLRSQVNLELPPNCNNWDNVSISLFLDNDLFKNVTLNRTEFTNDLLDSNNFFYDKFIELSELTLSEPQIINPQTNQTTEGINGTFTTVDGFTIIVTDGLITSITQN
jgi:hypothetical protein